MSELREAPSQHVFGDFLDEIDEQNQLLVGDGRMTPSYAKLIDGVSDAVAKSLSRWLGENGYVIAAKR